MRGRTIPLSAPRRFLADVLHFAARVPTVPVQRRTQLGAVAAARAAATDRPGWPALFIKAYARAAAERPALPPAYVPLPRMLMCAGLDLPRSRPNQFGTFGLTVYSSLGAESLHPVSPLTTTLTYGVIRPDGSADVRIVYDHRVLDGAAVARALARLEA